MREPDPRSAEFPPPGVAPRVPGEGEMFSVRIPGRGYTTTALTFAAMTVVFPFAIAPALGFAFAGQRRGDPWAQRTILVAFIALAAGVALGIVASNVDPDTFAWSGLYQSGR